ncbi:AAA ATPase domain-containing protein [Actinokineospora alba]|uniref:AAA ATPase domain-containing protein n=1 Tax=Actinokineospora alba TaxID=504798 RepID=A0A1H0W603_9PSEU|nr:ATP-binding protein [Actinokineospora alba]TDP70041.1 AAA ATPase-like protein [Actinokineospora alba]SDJ49317.1 AAA ATPase domain-containing protein [Actinokineospora alba]SDP86164.1 AAA ATPase domain-containing protein [Actinokineospora alba]
MEGGERLQELLAVLFDDPRELQSFLALEGVRVSVRPGGKGSSFAAEVAMELLRRGQVDERLFAALTRRFPDRAADIADVARSFLGVSAVDVPVVPELPPKYADFAAKLNAALSDTAVPSDEEVALDAEHLPWTAAAAVLGRFLPAKLRPLRPTPTSAVAMLAEFSHTAIDGSWILLDDVRTQCLRHLWETGALDDALAVNAELPDAERDKVRELLAGGRPSLAGLATAELEEYAVVTGWLELAGILDETVGTEVDATLERRALLDPLRALVGTHFHGRERELAVFDAFVYGVANPMLLCLRGPGGVGKSSLLGKVLLGLERAAGEDAAIPFAYLDFDRARNDPRDPIGLLRQIARQLRLLHATTEEARELAATESVYWGSDLEKASAILDIDLDSQGNLAAMVGVLADRLHKLMDLHGPAGYRTPLVLFLDTYEEVQLKGPGAVRDLERLIEHLLAALPDMRVIVSGRGDPTTFTGFENLILTLGELEPPAADAVLADLGVADPALRTSIVAKFGGHPLTLRLAAEALERTGTTAFDDIAARGDALAGIAIEQVQGMLYGRILSHIADPEVRRIAYPGLAVRRITVGVLREVLAEPCDLDPTHAELIFDKLRFEVSLFELDGPDTLRHRQDVRTLMLRSMMDEPGLAAVVARVHRRAIDYYHARPGIEDRAEEVYHRLMIGEDPRYLDRVWEPGLRPLLAPALGEPLPPRAWTWLSRRLGFGDTDDRAEWDQRDWEADAEGRAMSWLASGDPARALSVLAERTERLPDTRLHLVEVRARLAAADVDGAAAALERGMAAAAESDDRDTQVALAEQAVVVRGLRGDGSGVVSAAEWAVRGCDLLGDQTRGVDVLTDAVGILGGLDDAGEDLRGELASRFTNLSRSELLDNVDLVRRVLHTAGPADDTVLHHAATQVGDQTEADDGVFQHDPFAIARLLHATTPDAAPALADLAAEVGLSGRWKTEDLASWVVRAGRTGKAVVVGLDWARDAGQARRMVVDTLVRPVAGPDGRSKS